ncbi:MAG: UvrD-helicase domain-containing protein, partial [Opitutales bacterium]|nr:UvrD-helicase domain-containing protein [Opitutales bacterium]
GKINHWLLDEFQDTSTLQFKVLKQNIDDILSKKDPERSVFVVGDLKQSLYEWRSGNRKLLEKLDRDIAANGKSIPLDETRRCAQPVLDLVNLVLTYKPDAKGNYPHYFGQEAAADWARNFRPQKSHTDEGKPPKKGEGHQDQDPVPESDPRNPRPGGVDRRTPLEQPRLAGRRWPAEPRRHLRHPGLQEQAGRHACGRTPQTPRTGERRGQNTHHRGQSRDRRPRRHHPGDRAS